MTLFDFDGHKVFQQWPGSGPPTVFLPNATLDGKRWEFQADYFKGTRDVSVVDLPGFVRSDRLPHRSSWGFGGSAGSSPISTSHRSRSSANAWAASPVAGDT